MRHLFYPMLAIVSMMAWTAAAQAGHRPNILWIMIEDWGPDLSCYGTEGIHTPHVDKLASEGIRYDWAFTTSPVCSSSRSAMMTGFHQNYIGGEQHREYEELKRTLPHGVRPIPHLMAEAGYFTCLMSSKVDCNFLPDDRHELFMGKDWTERAPGQPFFARITLQGTHRSWLRDPNRPIPIKDVALPPYYADTPFIRRDWANGLEQMQLVDREVGDLLRRLDEEGLADNTLVFFIGDNGRCHYRGKQFLYDGGIRVPLIVRWPGKIVPGQVSESLVMSIDICATVLEVAGITPPVPLHGESLLSADLADRHYIFAARDRMGETHDAMRTIRSRDYKLILNLMPERPWAQYSSYKEGVYPALAEMNVLYLEGKLTPAQAAFFAKEKPVIELFDLRADPHEVNNVAEEPAYAEVKATLLAQLQKWRREVIHDKGVSDTFRATDIFPESCPDTTVAEWISKNRDSFDFRKYGYPGWYPTRSLDDWRQVRSTWEPYVFREPDARVPRPGVPFTSKTAKPKH